MGSANYQQEAWFIDLPKYEKDLVKSLEFAQGELKDSDEPLQATKDPLFKKEIAEKIDALFQENNFYFYDANGEDKDLEESEIKRLISDCMSSNKCYIKEGNLEPIHHQEGERKIIVDQMSNLLQRCTQEMLEQR